MFGDGGGRDAKAKWVRVDSKIAGADTVTVDIRGLGLGIVNMVESAVVVPFRPVDMARKFLHLIRSWRRKKSVERCLVRKNGTRQTR